jgi:uncharacterized membrane protein YbhN (UPF0104 family)
MNGWRNFLSVFLRLLIIALLLCPVALSVSRQWNEVRTIILSVRWDFLFLGIGTLILGHPLMGLISWFVLRYLGEKKPVLQIIGIYYLSQLAKYLPGGIWAFPGRVVAYRQVDIDSANAVVSVTREVSALFLGAAAVGLFGLVQGIDIVGWIRNAFVIGIGVCVLIILVTQIKFFWKLLLRVPKLHNTAIAHFKNPQYGFLNYQWLFVVTLISIAFWVITGFGFSFVIRAVNPTAYGYDWMQLASIFSLAWCAGFVIIIAPAGVGVRETALSILLMARMPEGDALSIALLARLWWTLAETVFILVFLTLAMKSGYLKFKIFRKHTPLENNDLT